MHGSAYAFCCQSCHEVGSRQELEEEKMRIRVGESAKRRSDRGLCGGEGEEVRTKGVFTHFYALAGHAREERYILLFSILW